MERAYDLCLLGLTEEQLARCLEVHADTITEWKSKHPKFGEALRRGREEADRHVARALYQRALGYSHPAVKIFNHEGRALVVPYTEHYPPDPASCIFWLKNRHSTLWRDKLAEFNLTQNVANVQLPENFMARVREYAQARFRKPEGRRPKAEGK